ncbi:hypothetical protein IJF81_06585 [bacterium]|nr:hypothetical protein [bacterium]
MPGPNAVNSNSSTNVPMNPPKTRKVETPKITRKAPPPVDPKEKVSSEKQSIFKTHDLNTVGIGNRSLANPQIRDMVADIKDDKEDGKDKANTLFDYVKEKLGSNEQKVNPEALGCVTTGAVVERMLKNGLLGKDQIETTQQIVEEPKEMSE